MVFFAAIRAGFMNPADLKAAYDTKGDATKLLMDAFSKKMILYDAVKGTPPTLEAGDIIVSNLAENFHHVFTIADRNKPIDELKVRHPDFLAFLMISKHNLQMLIQLLMYRSCNCGATSELVSPFTGTWVNFSPWPNRLVIPSTTFLNLMPKPLESRYVEQ